MTKILLVTTSFEKISREMSKNTTYYMHYPVGLTYLYSYLESKRHQMNLLYLNHSSYDDCLKEIIKNIKSFSPEIIGIQVLTATRVSTYKVIDYLHENYPKIKIVLGGIHATIMYKQLIEKYPFVKVVLGEGEITMDELSKEIFKENPEYSKIDGLAYFDKEVVRTKRRELIMELNSLPFPAHELFLKDKNRTSVCLLTSRGCPNACSFCCLNPEAKRIVRFRSPKNVVDEIEYIITKFPHVKEFFIHDDSFFIDNKRVIEICNEIKRRKIKTIFICSGRIKPVSKEMVKSLESVGFNQVLFGLESGSKEILESCRKGITPEDVINTFKLFKDSKINPKIFLIIGLPGETEETIKETTELIRKLQKISYTLFESGANILNVYPGTEVYEIAKRKEFIDDEFWLTDKETPLYTAEHSYEELQEFQEIMLNEISIFRIFTKKGFFPQIVMLPYAIKYFFKKAKSPKLLKSFIKSRIGIKNET